MAHDARAAVELCEKWAAKVAEELPCELFIFGSAIYKDGEQFDRESSDLDIVLLFPEPTSAVARVAFLEQMKAYKATLELEMIPALSRISCTETGCSIVAVTAFELSANIHKSAARQFFTKNVFYDLIKKNQIVGIPTAGSRTLPDENRYAIEYVQKVRNNFLAISANLTGGLQCYEGADPLPKDLMRAATHVVEVPDGEWYDTRHGLEALFADLKARQSENSQMQDLYDRVSIRRGGRGQRCNLSTSDQLLLTELLFDKAAL